MTTERLKVYETSAALDHVRGRQVDGSRPTDRLTEVTAGGPPYRLLWCRIAAGAPADPPDERYYGDEVRPAGVDSGGRLTWEPVPEGLREAILHNVAEAAVGSHQVPEDAIVRVEERLDRREPPEFVYLMDVAAPAQRLARIVSYESGTYTVQPVRHEDGDFQDDGPPLEGLPNFGELWDDEAGYLAGPTQFDRYVRIFRTADGWAICLHPPRMV
jgi:hypothetical protein